MVLVWIRTGRVGRRHIFYSSVAQSVEHLTVNQAVVGSSPIRGAKTTQRPFGPWVVFLYTGYETHRFVIREPTRSVCSKGFAYSANPQGAIYSFILVIRGGVATKGA